MEVTIIGLDPAKHWFQMHAVDASGCGSKNLIRCWRWGYPCMGLSMSSTKFHCLNCSANFPRMAFITLTVGDRMSRSRHQCTLCAGYGVVNRQCRQSGISRQSLGSAVSSASTSGLA
jgi:hypothetical protein